MFIWLQLLAWQRRCAQAGRGRALYRIAPQCSAAPRHLVAKPIKDASAAALDPRGAFIVQQDACLLVWKVDDPPSWLAWQHCWSNVWGGLSGTIRVSAAQACA